MYLEPKQICRLDLFDLSTVGRCTISVTWPNWQTDVLTLYRRYENKIFMYLQSKANFSNKFQNSYFIFSSIHHLCPFIFSFHFQHQNAEGLQHLNWEKCSNNSLALFLYRKFLMKIFMLVDVVFVVLTHKFFIRPAYRAGDLGHHTNLA